MCTSGFEKDAASDRPKGAIFPDGPMIQAKLMQINALFRSWSTCLHATFLRWRPWRRSPMTMQHDSQARRLANKMWVQPVLFTVAVVILIALAAKYVW